MSYVVLIAVFAVDRAFSGRRVVASAAARWLLESVSLKFVSLATRGEGERRKPHVRCMWCSHSLEATPVRVDVLVWTVRGLPWTGSAGGDRSLSRMGTRIPSASAASRCVDGVVLADRVACGVARECGERDTA